MTMKVVVMHKNVELVGFNFKPTELKKKDLVYFSVYRKNTALGGAVE